MAEHAEFKKVYLPTLKLENVQKILVSSVKYIEIGFLLSLRKRPVFPPTVGV
jgi:hypothetical protein